MRAVGQVTLPITSRGNTEQNLRFFTVLLPSFIRTVTADCCAVTAGRLLYFAWCYSLAVSILHLLAE